MPFIVNWRAPVITAQFGHFASEWLCLTCNAVPVAIQMGAVAGVAAVNGRSPGFPHSVTVLVVDIFVMAWRLPRRESARAVAWPLLDTSRRWLIVAGFFLLALVYPSPDRSYE